MKHISNYFEYVYEGKSQHTYVLKVDKNFNIFDLLNELKTHGAELLDNKLGKKKDEVTINIAMDDSKKNKVEDVIRSFAEIL